jgi:uncharacterized protein (DUF4415 family)
MDKEFDTGWSATSAVSHETAAPKQGAAAVKQIVTIRLDVDMLEWFKSAGPGYQTRINQVLREHMDAQRVAAPAAGN